MTKKQHITPEEDAAMRKATYFGAENWAYDGNY